MKYLLCVIALAGFSSLNVGCSGDSAPSKPETFAPLPGAAAGAAGASGQSGKKMDTKASAPIEPAS